MRKWVALVFRRAPSSAIGIASLVALLMLTASLAVGNPTPKAANRTVVPPSTMALGPTFPSTTTTTSRPPAPSTTAAHNAVRCGDPSGQCLPSTPSGYRAVCLDGFSVDAPTGSWNDPTESGNGVVYTGDHGCKWTTYPDGWRANDKFGGIYEPSQVLSVHDGVLDFYFHQVGGEPSAAAVAPILAGGRQFQTYGIYEFRARVVYDDAHRLDDYYYVPLLWPQSEGDWQWAESDWPEGHFDNTQFCAFAHYGGDGSQDQYCTDIDLTQWHTYTQVWKPGERDYYVDGTLVGTTTDQVYKSPESWYIQTEADDGLPNDGTTGHLLVDWVAVYAPG